MDENRSFKKKRFSERGGIAATCRKVYGGACQDQRATRGDRGLEKHIRLRNRVGLSQNHANRTDPATGPRLRRKSRVVHPPERACRCDLSRKFHNFWNLFRQIIRAWEGTHQRSTNRYAEVFKSCTITEGCRSGASVPYRSFTVFCISFYICNFLL
ncbi:uncharacterized protein LOC111480035 [Cucurbita maxima]|uniref:Uncharacterized protein LOC111480035 n=1 Tax=Cucurbita maxima TaxID=3661 RepID=A0A6J1IUH5_CUCMA|nr:uncharacterized protein LOC111480035 [Cucurbita maxima]